MTQDRLAFGRALAAARKARAISQAELGRRVGGVVQATISSWETGVTEPTPGQVFEMEQALGIDGGHLSKHLGYIPVSERYAIAPRAADYITDDPTLEPWAKRVLLGVYNEVASTRVQRHGFEHAIFFHHGRDEYYSGVTEYIRQGLMAEEPVIVMAGEEHSDLLSTMGRDMARVAFWEDRNPGRLLSRWRAQLTENSGMSIRAVQDQACAWDAAGLGTTHTMQFAAVYMLEYHRHEMMLNTAFADGPSWTLLCPYDLDAIPDNIAEHANSSHPLVWQDGGLRPNPGYSPVPPEELLELALPQPPHDPSTERFDPTSWRSSLGPLIALAGDCLSDVAAVDFTLAVRDIAAASARHGRGEVLLRWWAEEGAVGCEISDEGRITDPFIDRMLVDGRMDRALVQAQQLCDLVALRSGDFGTIVRMYMVEDSDMETPPHRAVERVRNRARPDSLAQMA